jgi:hypothetical protein
MLEVVVHTLSTWDAEPGGVGVQTHLELHREMLCDSQVFVAVT